MALAFTCQAFAQVDISFDNNQLQYWADERGNRVPDFSYAGYRGGEVELPSVPAKVQVDSAGDHDAEVIQAAIDQVSQLPLDSNGFRGAVLLAPGDYHLNAPLRLHASGVVLRGSGFGQGGTRLIAARWRSTVIEIKGTAAQLIAGALTGADSYVPVNAMKLSVGEQHSLVAGDMINVRHVSSDDWIAALQMNDFGGDRHGPRWRKGACDVNFVRKITRVEDQVLHLDAPLTLGMDKSLSTVTVTKLDTQGLVRNAAVENLLIEADFDNSRMHDEEHAWMGVTIENARDVWVRRVVFKNLVCSAVAVWDSASRVTVEDCKSLQPSGEIGGWRRIAFLNCGQQVLMQRLYSEDALHDFAVGRTAAGPNAFVQCESSRSLGDSGTIDSAACGTLFDCVRIDGQPLSLRNRGSHGQGIGWSSFNGAMWNCTASIIVNERPPLAQNWAFGTHGEFNGNGYWQNSDDDIQPPSLYYAQLGQRLNVTVRSRGHLLLPTLEGSRAPTLAQAAKATAASNSSRPSMSNWIDTLASDHPLTDADRDTAPASGAFRVQPPVKLESKTYRPLCVENGWLTIDSRLAIGQFASVPWWNGGLQAEEIAKAIPAVTRYVPGRISTGLTDDLQAVAEAMQAKGQIALWQHPPLWYERRRDDHSRVRRSDAEVVGPFYEMPWARSGQGNAMDGLSLWDLSRVNPWYFSRLRSFSQLAAQKGVLLFNGMYMQHNLLEAGAHYVDSPWRAANNLQSVGLPEPVNFAGDKLIFAAEQFYDVTNAAQVELHRQYMRRVLEELKDQPNTIHYLSEEYTGPLSFMQLWLDTIHQWSTETGKKPLIALVATKDVIDSVLADPQRANVVSMVVNRENWWYQPDGDLYAPEGGKNLAPRQWQRLLKPKAARFADVHRTVVEFRRACPDVPFVYNCPGALAWAAVLGGASLPQLPPTTDAKLLQQLPSMQPLRSGVGLSDGSGNQLIYADQPPQGGRVHNVDMATGQITDAPSKLYWMTSQ